MPPEQWGQWGHTNTWDTQRPRTCISHRSGPPVIASKTNALEKRKKKKKTELPIPLVPTLLSESQPPPRTHRRAIQVQTHQPLSGLIRANVCSSPNIIYCPFSAETVLKKSYGSWEMCQPSTSLRLMGFIKVGSGGHEKRLHCSKKQRAVGNGRSDGLPGMDTQTQAQFCSGSPGPRSSPARPSFQTCKRLRQNPRQHPETGLQTRAIQLTRCHTF